MIPRKNIEDLILKHSLLEKELSSGVVDKKLFAEKSKEYSDLNDIIEDARIYISYDKEKKELEKILEDTNSDKEIKIMAVNEVEDLKKNHEIKETMGTPGDSFGYDASNKYLKSKFKNYKFISLEKGLKLYFKWIKKVPIVKDLRKYHPFKINKYGTTKFRIY